MASPYVAVFATVDGFRVALPMLRWVFWFCLADGFRVALPILRWCCGFVWLMGLALLYSVYILCHLLCM